MKTYDKPNQVTRHAYQSPCLSEERPPSSKLRSRLVVSMELGSSCTGGAGSAHSASAQFLRQPRSKGFLNAPSWPCRYLYLVQLAISLVVAFRAICMPCSSPDATLGMASVRLSVQTKGRKQ